IIEIARIASQNDAAANAKFYQYLSIYEKDIGLVEYFGQTTAAIPCLFAGALIEVHILCDAIGDPDCKVRDIARLIMGRLAFVGGSPRPAVKPSINDPIQQIKKAVTSLEEDVAKAGKVKLPAYAKPGELLKGSG